MNTIKIYLLLSFFSVSGILLSQTGWQEYVTDKIVDFNGIEGEYIIGDSGKIYNANGDFTKYTSWTIENPNTSATLTDIKNYFSYNYVLIGHNGTIRRKIGTGAWTIVNSGTNKNLNAITFPNSTIGIIAGDSGLILRSLNSGGAWSIINTGIVASLRDISFYNASTGIAVGDGGSIYFSSDTGATWLLIPCPTSENLNSVFFLNASNGYIVGNNGTFLTTANGGLTWQSVNVSYNFDFKTVYFTNLNQGYIGGHNFVIETGNSGNSWDKMLTGVSEINRFAVVNTKLYAACTDAKIQLQVNYDWIHLNVDNNTPGINPQDAYFIDSLNGFAVSGKKVYRTVDGAHFDKIFSFSQANCNSIHFISPAEGFIAGDSIFRTLDSGFTWSNITANLTGIGYKIYFLTDSIGYCRVSNSVYKTTNAGQSWQSITPAQDFFFFNKDTGYVVSSGTIKRTLNGGSSWLDVFTSSTFTPYLIASDLNHIYAYPSDTSTYRTLDGGRNWFRSKIPLSSYPATGGSIKGLIYTDTLYGYCVYTANGFLNIAKTTNHSSTTNWSVQSSETLYSGGADCKFLFPDKNHGYLNVPSQGIYKNVNTDPYIPPSAPVTDNYSRVKSPDYEWFLTNSSSNSVSWSNASAVTVDSSNYIIYGGSYDGALKIDTMVMPTYTQVGSTGKSGLFIAKVNNKKNIIYGVSFYSVNGSSPKLSKLCSNSKNEIIFCGKYRGDSLVIADTFLLNSTPLAYRAFLGVLDSSGNLKGITQYINEFGIKDIDVNDTLIYISGSHFSGENFDTLQFSTPSGHIIVTDNNFKIQWFKNLQSNCDKIDVDIFKNIFVVSRGGGGVINVDGISINTTSSYNDILIKINAVTKTASWIRKVDNLFDNYPKITTDNLGNVTLGVVIKNSTWVENRWVSVPLLSPNQCGLLLAQYSPNGNLRWIDRIPLVTYLSVVNFNLRADPWNNIFVTSQFDYHSYFSDTLLDANFMKAGFVAKYDVDGVGKWINTIQGPSPNGSGWFLLFNDVVPANDSSIYFAFQIQGQDFNSSGEFSGPANYMGILGKINPNHACWPPDLVNSINFVKDSICPGSINNIFNVQSIPGVQYNWNYTGQNISIINQGDTAVLNAGINATQGVLTVNAQNYCGYTSQIQSLNIAVLPVPVINVNSDTTICSGSSVVLTATGNASTFSWNNNITNGSSFFPLATDTLFVSGIGTNGCIGTNSFVIVVDSMCEIVWPGDANNDGMANNVDVLELGLHFIASGPPRDSITNIWLANEGYVWNDTVSTGFNLNHSDCNGDGIVNQIDTLAIHLNYGLSHGFKLSPVTFSQNPQLYFDSSQVNSFPNNWMTIPLYFGDSANTINDFYGLALDISFDNGLITPDSIFFVHTSSWTDLSSSNIKFNKKDFSQGKIFLANVRTSFSNINGYGQIGYLSFKITNNVFSDTILHIGIQSPLALSYPGTLSTIISSDIDINIHVLSTGLEASDRNIENSPYVYPNPGTDIITIVYPSFDKQIGTTAILTDITGKEISRQELHGNKSNYDIHALSAGVYFLQIKNLNNTKSLRLIKQ